MRTPLHPTKAFSAPELLIAVVILAAIAAFMFPSFQRLREESIRVKCMGNLRSYGTAVMAYLGDNNNRFIDERPNFRALLVPAYLPTQLRCPLIRNPKEEGFHYTGNMGIIQYYPNPLTIPAPFGRIVFASEAYFDIDGFWSPTHMNGTINGSVDKRRPQYHGTESKKTLNLFFLDGHIEALAAKDNDWFIRNSEGGLYAEDKGGGIFFATPQYRRIQMGFTKFD